MNEIIEQRRGGYILIERATNITYNVIVCSDSHPTKLSFGPLTLTDASSLADLMVKAPIIEVAR